MSQVPFSSSQLTWFPWRHLQDPTVCSIPENIMPIKQKLRLHLLLNVLLLSF